MGPNQSSTDRALLQDIRQRRAELRESMIAVELALAGPAPPDRTAHWAGRVNAALLELSGDFRAHVAITEGPDGLYHDLLRTAPRLTGPVDLLAHDHVLVNQSLEGLLALLDVPSVDVEKVRRLGTALLGMVVRHRQRGADLVYEAYEVDIGGDE